MKHTPYAYRGFTLIELSISMAIIGLLTTLLLVRYPDTAVRMTLVNHVQSTALLIREAQVRGSAIDTNLGAFGGYGVYASLTFPGQITLFADTVDQAASVNRELPVGNGLFDSSPFNETSSVVRFSKGFILKKVCTGTGYPYTCNQAANPDIDSVTISFTRPNPLPSLYVNGNSAVTVPGVCLELRSYRAPLIGHIRSVQVFHSGIIRTVIGGCDAS